ncbi:gephyrin-like molybdotransferase Glp [Granulosicoccus antarcticus]|uniref:Molybdopterin molybdenumtransferase n=1 Tax=Granulosicoccus antarcticus IMCC3135 TaxID=1192854 RepID=A0A2Z2NTZ0_9GAMM|nr:gephyrin-like molybdotransferase Glp [Granulosicoccus antarcticus]ASJ75032.1 Molybdopterin molybdenumtransferase [Granulosicoccus antarcticus IMCC3135]
MIEKQPSCDDVLEPALLPVEEARRRLFASLQPIDESLELHIAQALNRVLAEDVTSAVNVPPQANSAMDGYALSRTSIPDNGEAALTVIGTAWAGKPFDTRVETGQAVRIFTGGIMPEGCDTVVIQEHVRARQASDSEAGSIDIDHHVVAGKNVRQAGEDVARGQVILQQGRKLQAADIGVLASLGIAHVRVIRPLKVAFFSTGDELRSLEEHEAGTDLEPGMLFDSNRYTMAALLAGLHVDFIDMGIVRDNEADTRQAMLDAAAAADVVITSGGVSAGEADYVTRAFHDIGQVSFWKLAMRPGRPLAYGQIGSAAFFGLPGNPVAVMVTFLEFVQPALKHLAGMSELDPLLLPARSLSSLRKSAGRVEYQRGVMSLDSQGELVVESTGKQGAGRLSSMSLANCLIVIASEIDGVQAGDRVQVQPFHGLLPG